MEPTDVIVVCASADYAKKMALRVVRGALSNFYRTPQQAQAAWRRYPAPSRAHYNVWRVRGAGGLFPSTECLTPQETTDSTDPANTTDLA